MWLWLEFDNTDEKEGDSSLHDYFGRDLGSLQTKLEFYSSSDKQKLKIPVGSGKDRCRTETWSNILEVGRF